MRVLLKQGVTCSCCHPSLEMTVRMRPSHFTIWVSVPSFSEDQRNRNSRYEIKGVISQSFYLAPSPLCFLSTSGESFIHLPLCHVRAQRKVSKNHITYYICVPAPRHPPRPEPFLSCPLEGTGPSAPIISSRLALLRNAHVYPAVCISHKVALGRGMIPPHLPAVTCLVHSKS